MNNSFKRENKKSERIYKPDFVAIDFEHATRIKGTVCSVGIVSFKDGEIVDEYYTLVQPPNNEYEWRNTKKHKISSLDTVNSPTFKEIFHELNDRINGSVIVAHGAHHTDKHCLEQAMELEGITDTLNIQWECTQIICDSSLDIACKVCNISLDHHHALSDATASGILYNLYLNGRIPFEDIQTERSVQKQLEKAKQDFYPEKLKGDILKPDFKNAKNTDNPFFMKKVVISGFENSIKKKLALELKGLGADIDSAIGKKTNYLIIGQTPGPSKLVKMQTNIDEGKEAEIITFEDYNKLKNNEVI